MKQKRFDLLVVGAGPAGLAAAHAAARRGAKVGLVDAQPRAGGQVWRHDLRFGVPAMARAQIDGLHGAGIEWLAGHEMVLADDHVVVAAHADGAVALHWRTLVLATGARELLLPFPGWTLPGVTGAGGLQALAKQGWPVAGKRVVVAGSGPLLLAAAATLRRHGAHVLGIHEQVQVRTLHAFARRLWRWPARLAQAAALRARLLGVPWHTGSMVLAAHGDTMLRAIELDRGDGRERIACDLLAVGWGLVPNVEPARLLGCELDTSPTHPVVRADRRLCSSRPGIHAAGEALGIGGRDCARIEGAMAACFALGDERGGEALRARRDHERAYAALLHECFATSARARALAAPDTLVCRCEDVPLSAVQAHADPRQLRLVTRCGMGACQGRICGAALRELQLASPSLSPTAVRPPLAPVTLAALADDPSDEPEQGTDR
ncbi:FAD/NAD(P)-binding oxidoreductase [Stenotrophomonas sp. NLF4-10]|uniref:NAD(P)/FAD-dependent oxidoreductase n=1 Tax=Stenotrophomonas sp. NLF4-10 TaxID=2918754 RepID=UPI001EFB90E1|nr:FAD/NAD(P)-binding oxidoreductase [Stenotrophomonas sp. NLF4-10]MCG8275104.1 NAD(P)/FAD-dependent oxidoreductase [Stenotrophomonas sp. NLF4-10]